jgi:hypothetical protein
MCIVYALVRFKLAKQFSLDFNVLFFSLKQITKRNENNKLYFLNEFLHNILSNCP